MKKLLSLTLALMLLLSLCASAVAEETITLDFWVRTSDDFSSEIAAFEAANPGIKINQVQVGENYDDLVAKYNAAIAADNLPQVGMVGQRHGIPQFYDAGKLIPIENYMTQEEQDDVIDGFWVRYTYNGVRLAVPFQSSMPMLYYNQTMLEELGLEVPTAFTEMIETWTATARRISTASTWLPTPPGMCSRWCGASAEPSLTKTATPMSTPRK